jgi:hypothetical protein
LAHVAALGTWRYMVERLVDLEQRALFGCGEPLVSPDRVDNGRFVIGLPRDTCIRPQGIRRCAQGRRDRVQHALRWRTYTALDL